MSNALQTDARIVERFTLQSFNGGNMAYIKARFTSKSNGSTAGLIIEADKLYKMPITEFSRLFPVYEASKMDRTELSPEYDTWEEAFLHNFDA
jgi:hypothetical protein